MAASLVNRARVLYRRGDSPAAIAQLDAALALQEDPLALFLRGNAKDECGDYRGAIADYSRCLELRPALEAARLNRGACKARLGDDDGAMEDLRSVKDAGEKGALFNAGNVELSRGNARGAAAAFTQALVLDPKFLEAYCNRALAREQCGDGMGAVQDYTAALALNDTDRDARYNRGNCRYRLGDYRGALSDLDECLARNPWDCGALNNRACAKRRLGDCDGSLADCDKALECAMVHKLPAQESSRAWRNRGDALQQRAQGGDVALAVEAYDQCLELDPEDALARLHRGNALHKLREFSGATQDYARALELAPAFARRRDGPSAPCSLEACGATRRPAVALATQPPCSATGGTLEEVCLTTWRPSSIASLPAATR